MEVQRKIGLFAVESDYQSVQAKRSQEWQELADEQPIYICADDTVVGVDKRLLQAGSSIIASNEIMDKVEYTVAKSAYSEWLDNDKLRLDEIGCEGPTDTSKWYSLGKKVLTCSSPDRIKRLRDFNLKMNGIQN